MSGETRSESQCRFYLGIFDDHLRGVPLHDGTLLIGRSKSNHLQLHDHLLSRKHCSLSLTGDRLTLVDLNSSNGTFVNGERVGTREVGMDDIVELGKTVMVVYDGDSWGQGHGMMNLRNPLKAQELVQRLGENGLALAGSPSDGEKKGGSRNGVRARKGLASEEKSFLRWLEQGESRVLPGLVTDYLTHKLISLLVRNSKPVRAAFTTVLEEMMRPQFFMRFGDTDALRQGIEELVARELEDLREEPEVEEERDLLEQPDENGGGDPTPEPAEETPFGRAGAEGEVPHGG